MNLKHTPKKRALIFQPHHVPLLLSGTKIETRRLVLATKNPPPAHPRGQEPLRVGDLPFGAGLWCRPVQAGGPGSMRYVERLAEHCEQVYPHRQIIPDDERVLKLGTLLYAREACEYRMVAGKIEVRYAQGDVLGSPRHVGYRETDWTAIRARHAPFFASRCMMELVHCHHEPLGAISDESCIWEGYGSRAGFVAAWDQLHGRGSFEAKSTGMVEVLRFEVLAPEEFERVREVIMWSYL